MFPYIMIFNKMITSYTIMVLIGILVVGFLGVHFAKKYHIDENDLILFALVSAIGMFFGGHILYGLVNYEMIGYLFLHFHEITTFQSFWQCMQIIFGGSVFYGGLIGFLVVGYLYGKRKHLDLKKYYFVITPLIPLFHFFGRIGCFLYGCCYGIESEFGFTYTNSLILSANGVSRFPVQLVEAGGNLLLFFFLLYLQRKNKCSDILLYLYLVCYSIMRFGLEFLRGDVYRGVYFGLSTSQIISIFLLIFSIIRIIWIKRKIKN